MELCWIEIDQIEIQSEILLLNKISYCAVYSINTAVFASWLDFELDLKHEYH